MASGPESLARTAYAGDPTMTASTFGCPRRIQKTCRPKQNVMWDSPEICADLNWPFSQDEAPRPPFYSRLGNLAHFCNHDPSGEFESRGEG